MPDIRLSHTQEALVAFAHEREEHDQWIASQMTPLAAVWDNDDDAIYDRL